MGKLNAGKLIAAYVPFIIVTPFYCYYMSVKNGEEKPYPAATITQTACHYPQDIVFRYFMLIASSMLALIFFMMFRWLAAAVKQSGYPVSMPNYMFYLCEFSILLYGVTIGTIDGKSTGPLHSPCAVIFFVILIVAIVQVTLFMTNLRAYDTKTIKYNSLLWKQGLAIFVVGVWIYCLVMIIYVSINSSTDEQFEGKTDKYVVIVEWNTVTIGLLWVLTWVYEWDKFYLTLVGPKLFDLESNVLPHLECSKKEQLVERKVYYEKEMQE